MRFLHSKKAYMCYGVSEQKRFDTKREEWTFADRQYEMTHGRKSASLILKRDDKNIQKGILRKWDKRKT